MACWVPTASCSQGRPAIGLTELTSNSPRSDRSTVRPSDAGRQASDDEVPRPLSDEMRPVGDTSLDGRHRRLGAQTARSAVAYRVGVIDCRKFSLVSEAKQNGNAADGSG
jgi:hypothetical protein